MPDKPLWYARLDACIADFEALPEPWVHTEHVHTILGVGKRRAQQIIAPMVSKNIGRSGIAHRNEFLDHLRKVAQGEVAFYERRRVERLRAILTEARATPRVLVEAPASVDHSTFASLPGIELAKGEIRVRFSTPEEAMQRLLALAMAMGNEPEEFHEMVS